MAAAALLWSLPFAGAAAPLDGDAERGRRIYERCQACHSLERNRSGPKHCGLAGRRAAGVEGYRYSRALQEAGIVWSAETLDRFLEDPLGTVPGTRMAYAGVKDEQERTDLIAFLLQAPGCTVER